MNSSHQGASRLQSIDRVAAELGLAEPDLELYGPTKAKLSLAALSRARERPPGKLIVVILPDLGERYLSTALYPE